MFKKLQNKVAQQVTNREAFKFQFNLSIDHLTEAKEKKKDECTYAIFWKRGKKRKGETEFNKIEGTRIVWNRTFKFNGTLYFKKGKFQKKDLQITLEEKGKNGKTNSLVKESLDLALFVDEDSEKTTTKEVDMPTKDSSKAKLKIVINSKCLKDQNPNDEDFTAVSTYTGGNDEVDEDEGTNQDIGEDKDEEEHEEHDYYDHEEHNYDEEDHHEPEVEVNEEDIERDIEEQMKEEEEHPEEHHDEPEEEDEQVEKGTEEEDEENNQHSETDESAQVSSHVDTAEFERQITHLKRKVKLLLKQVKTLKENDKTNLLKKVQKERDSAVEKLKNLQKENEDLIKQRDKAQESQQEVDSKLFELQLKQKQAQKNETEIKKLKDRIKELEEENENGRASSSKQKQSLSYEYDEKIQNFEEEIKNMREQAKEYEEQLIADKKQIDKMKRENEKLQEDMKSQKNSVNEDKKSKFALEEEIEKLKEENEELNQKAMDMDDKFSELENKLKKGKNRITELEEQIDELEQDKRRLEKVQKQFDENQKSKAGNEQETKKLKDQLSLLQNSDVEKFIVESAIIYSQPSDYLGSSKVPTPTKVLFLATLKFSPESSKFFCTNIIKALSYVVDRYARDEEMMMYWVNVLYRLLNLYQSSGNENQVHHSFETMEGVTVQAILAKEEERTLAEPPVYSVLEDDEVYVADMQEFTDALTDILARAYLNLCSKIVQLLKDRLVKAVFNPKQASSKSTDGGPDMRLCISLLTEIYQRVEQQKLDKRVVNHIFENVAMCLDSIIFNHFIKDASASKGLSVKMSVAFLENWFNSKNVIQSLRKQFHDNEDFDEEKLQVYFTLSRQAADICVIAQKQLLEDEGTRQEVCPELTVQQIAYIYSNYETDEYSNTTFSQREIEELIGKKIPTLDNVLSKPLVDFNYFTDLGSKKPLQANVFEFDMLDGHGKINSLEIPKRFFPSKLAEQLNTFLK